MTNKIYERHAALIIEKGFQENKEAAMGHTKITLDVSESVAVFVKKNNCEFYESPNFWIHEGKRYTTEELIHYFHLA